MSSADKPDEATTKLQKEKFPTLKPKKRTLSDTITRLRREHDKLPRQVTSQRDDVTNDVGLKCRWYLVSEEEKVVMTADTEAIKKDNYFIVPHPSSSNPHSVTKQQLVDADKLPGQPTTDEALDL